MSCCRLPQPLFRLDLSDLENALWIAFIPVARCRNHV